MSHGALLCVSDGCCVQWFAVVYQTACDELPYHGYDAKSGQGTSYCEPSAASLVSVCGCMRACCACLLKLHALVETCQKACKELPS